MLAVLFMLTFTHGVSLTVNVATQGHHARSLRAAEGRVMQLVGQRWGHACLRVGLRRAAVLRRVLFVPCSTVLKPNLQQKKDKKQDRR